VAVLSVDHLEGALLSQHSTRAIHSLYRLITVQALFSGPHRIEIVD